MATVQKFEDLICWQRARELTRETYKTFKSLNDYDFRDQIQRASVSVMSNIAEGFERGTQAEFINYLFIAKGSAGEVRAQLYAALDIGYLNIVSLRDISQREKTFKYLNELATECSKLIASFIRSLKVSKFGGLQFKKERSKQQLRAQKFQKWLDDSQEARKQGEKPPEFEGFYE